MPFETSPRRRLVFAGAAVAALALAAAGWWAARGGRTPDIAPDDARPIAEAFLGDVRTGKPDRVDAAWQGTTAEFKSYQGREQFRKFVRANKALAAPAEFQECQVTEANGLRVARCRFRTASGAPLTVMLAPEGGEWKVGRLLLE